MKIKYTLLMLLAIFLLSGNVFAGVDLLPEACLAPGLKIQADDFSIQFKGFFNDQDNDNIRAQLDAFNEAQRYFAEKIIAQGGKITFAEFMQEALYSKHGSFMKNISVGKAHDNSFNTYAEDSKFGKAIAKQLSEMWEKMGNPDKFSIVEMGAGTGELAKNIIVYIQQNEPELFKALDYVIVEISPKLKSDQETKLKQLFDSSVKVPVRWIKGESAPAAASEGLAVSDSKDTEATALDLSELKDIQGVFLSNEMPDNFPIHRIKKVNGEFKEVYVTFKDRKFQDELGPLYSQDLRDYVDNLKVEIKDGVEIPVNLNLKIWQENISRALKKGFVLTIDYGGKINEITRNPYAVWNKETQKIQDIYADCGNCDITAEVNFYDIANWGKINGLQVQGYTLQRDFLWNLGVDIPKASTNFYFKVLVQSKNIDTKVKLKGFTISEEDKDEYEYEYEYDKDEYGYKYKNEAEKKRAEMSKMRGEVIKETAENLGIQDLEFLMGDEPIKLVLPIGPGESKFVVYTRDINFDKNAISNGLDAVQASIRFKKHETKIITLDGSNTYEGSVENDKYVLHVKRSDLPEIEIYNAQGQRIFNGFQQFENIKDELAIEYAKRYSTRFDLEKADYEEIPDIFYLHQDGSLQSFSPEFLPKGVMDKQSLPENRINQEIEQAI